MNKLAKFLIISSTCLSTSSFAENALRYFGQQENSYISSIAYGNNRQAGHYQNVGDTQIYYEIYGSGKPVVVLHGGLVGSIAEMGQFIDKLSPNYQVIAVSTRGHGKSGIGSLTPSYSQKAKDLNAVLGQVKEPVTLLGFSDGAYTAYQFALDYPEKVSKIIAIGAGTWKKGFRHFGGSFTDFSKLDTNYWQQQQGIRPEPARMNEWYQKNIMYFNQLEVSAESLSKITQPVLVLAGEKDQNAPLDTIISAYKAIPNAQLAIIPNAPHPVFQVNFPAVWENIEPFLKHDKYYQ